MKRLFAVLPYGFIFLAVVVFFYKSIVYGFIPAPTDALVGLYHPWRDLYAATNPRGIPFKNFLITDPVRQQIPWRKIAIDQWKAQGIPAWNPYTFLGVPLVANIQAGIYQPVNVLFTIFDFPLAWTFVVLLQPLFGALFLFLYLKNLKLSIASAYIGAMVWAFGGFSIAWITWGTIGWVAAFIPLVLYGIDKMRHLYTEKKTSQGAFIAVALLIGSAAVLVVLSGHAQIALYGLIVSFLYGVYRLSAVAKRSHVFWFTLLSLGILLVGSYVLWQPFLAFYTSTPRSSTGDLSMVSGWLMPVEHLIQFLVPDFFGNPTTLNYYGVWNYGEMIGYIGVIPIILALSSLWVGGVSVFWSWVFVASLALMVYSPLTSSLYGLHIPILSTLQPTRLLVLVDLSLAILTAFGMEAFLAKKRTRLYVSYGVVTSVFFVVTLTVMYFQKMSANQEMISHMAISLRNLAVPFVLLLGFGALLLFDRLRKKHVVLTIAVCIILFSLIDLFRFGWKFTPFTAKEYFFPVTKTIAFLQSQPKPFRVMSLDDRILPPNSGGYFGIETIEGYDPLYPADYGSFVFGNTSSNTNALQRIFTLHDIHNPVLPYLNVRYVLSLDEIHNSDFLKVLEEGQTKIYKYTKGLDRVYLSTHDDVTAKDYMKNTLLVSQNGVVTEGQKNPRGIEEPRVNSDEFAVITNYADNAISIKASVTTERTVVILNRYDAGWRASIDGKIVPIFKANQIFQGIDIPTGEHAIELWYTSL